MTQFFEIKRITPFDVLTVTRMAYANMLGVDEQFTKIIGRRWGRWLGYTWLPLYFLLAGEGYKVIHEEKMIACAYLKQNQLSGFVFNVNVNHAFRRQGVARRLMQHLEKRVQQNGRSWMALQVDGSNDIAQRLYTQLGYRPYHPHYLGSHEPEALPRDVMPHVQINPLRGGRRWYFRHYTDIEQAAGDKWAATVVKQEYRSHIAVSGRHWSCQIYGETVGYAWLGGQKNPMIHLALIPTWWGQSETLSILRLLLSEWPRAKTVVYLYAGSSGHLTELMQLLRPFGFKQYDKASLLMLKQIVE